MSNYYDDEDRQLDQVHALMGNSDFWCEKCKHFNKKEEITCEAFPDQIPSPIITGQLRHIKKMFDQDNDILFTPIK